MPHMPQFYFGRINGNSDRYWIETRMNWIPEDKQKEIAEKYSQIYLSEKTTARKKANVWLNDIAREYWNDASKNRGS